MQIQELTITWDTHLAIQSSQQGYRLSNPNRNTVSFLRLRELALHSRDALVLPGGVFSPDALRLDHESVQFVRSFFDAHKPVAAICHGPLMLIEADVINGRDRYWLVAGYPNVNGPVIALLPSGNSPNGSDSDCKRSADKQ